MGKNVSESIGLPIKLAVFDFDDTLVSCELSDYISHIREDKNGNKIPEIKIPNEINEIYEAWNWPFRMNAFFKYINANYDITSEQIVNEVSKIKIDNSIKELIRDLKRNDYKLLIISDCNSLFIDIVLKENGLGKVFDRIYTNQAKINGNGIIKLKAFYESILDKSNCPCELCSKACALPSMCKKNILSTLDADKPNVHIVYIGDGSNDFCAATCLKESDFLFVRKNYALDGMLKQQHKDVKAKIEYWSDGQDILNSIVF